MDESGAGRMAFRDGRSSWGNSWGTGGGAGERPYTSPFTSGSAGGPPSDGEWRGERFRVGRVFSLTFEVLGKSPLFYYSLSLIASLPGVLLKMGGNPSRDLFEYIVDIFFTVIFTGAIAYGVYQHLTGGKVNIVSAIGKGLSRYFSLVGVSFLLTVMLFAIVLVTGITIVISVFFVVLPVIATVYILVIFLVAVPACVVEGKGPVASLERSANLTWKCRGAIFGVLILYGLIVLAGRLMGGAISDGAREVGVLDIFTAPLYVGLYQVLSVTAYYQLRMAKEGVSIDRLATVFD